MSPKIVQKLYINVEIKKNNLIKYFYQTDLS